MVFSWLEDLWRRGFKQTPPPQEDGADVDNEDDIVVHPPYRGSSKPVSKPKESRYHWILDSGHGKLTSGKRSPVFPDGTQLLEWEFNADIVGRVSEMLRELGIDHSFTIPLDELPEVGNALTRRVASANAVKSPKPRILVSVHGNAGPTRSVNHFTDDSVSGIEVWHYHGSRVGYAIASIFQQMLLKYTKRRDRKVKSKKEKQFYILRATDMPAVLTENGFFNNKIEGRLMLSDKYRQSVAKAHVAAIEYIEKHTIHYD